MGIQRRLYKLWLRLRSLFLRSRVEHELDEEMEFHLQRQIEDNIRKGLSPEEARHSAMLAFAGVEQQKELCRDVRGLNVVDNLIKASIPWTYYVTNRIRSDLIHR